MGEGQKKDGVTHENGLKKTNEERVKRSEKHNLRTSRVTNLGREEVDVSEETTIEGNNTRLYG